MYEGQIVRTAHRYRYGWTCSCGKSKHPYTNLFSQVEGDLEAHIRDHDRETFEEDERFLEGVPTPTIKRITPLDRREYVLLYLESFRQLHIADREKHTIELVPIENDIEEKKGMFFWRCTCRHNIIRPGGRGMGARSSLRGAANNALTHIERMHQDHNLSITCPPNALQRIPNKSDDDDTTDATQIPIEHDPGAPQHAQTQRPTQTINPHLIQHIRAQRWELFADIELQNLSDAIFESDEPGRLYEEINQELVRRGHDPT